MGTEDLEELAHQDLDWDSRSPGLQGSTIDGPCNGRCKARDCAFLLVVQERASLSALLRHLPGSSLPRLGDLAWPLLHVRTAWPSGAHSPKLSCHLLATSGVTPERLHMRANTPTSLPTLGLFNALRTDRTTGRWISPLWVPILLTLLGSPLG